MIGSLSSASAPAGVVLVSMCVTVVEDNKQWWKLLNRSGVSGYVPHNILDVVKLEEPQGQPEPLYSQPNQRYKGDMSAWGGGPMSPRGGGPISPRGGGPMSPINCQLGRQESFELGGPMLSPRNKEQRILQMDEVNDELLQRITTNKSQPPARNFKVERTQSALVPLNFDSGAGQVKAWLEAKGFTTQTVQSLGILTGAQLFSLNKEELKVVCGDEGSRVYSQITVQKAQLEVSPSALTPRLPSPSVLPPRLPSPSVLPPRLPSPSVLPPRLPSPSVLPPRLPSPSVLPPRLPSPSVLPPRLPSPSVLPPRLPSPSVLPPRLPSPSVLPPRLPSPSVLPPRLPSPSVLPPRLPSPSVLTPRLPSPSVLTPRFPSPSALTPRLPSPSVLTPRLPSPSVLTPRFPSPSALTPRLPSPSVLTPRLPSPSVLTPRFPSPSALTPRLPSPSQSLGSSYLRCPRCPWL
ncbi:Epidermal growth factor receptor kinase substrate 8-like protein 2 [Acipenser ruthenus]|uniref:Epidermal growth factor receptor kinase substrate 8-like protein 2 n=1 Tax=Acipenser ruthenus TaxID=7906 RepID=A0A444U4G9_ACIRT|nr:Epidermal growth factor receptor kinase substrate 8-like protein 2 [Acipenser ruthenus]